MWIRVSIVLPPLAACGRIFFAPGTIEPDTDAGIDAVDGAIDAVSVACPNVEFADDFGNGVFDSRWQPFANDAGMLVTEETGFARVTLGTGIQPNRSAGIADAVVRDYRGRCVAIAIDALPTVGGVFSKMFLGNDADHAGFQVDQDTLGVFRRIGGIEEPGPETAFSPTQHQVLRMRMIAPDIVFDTAPSLAGPFTQFATVDATPIPLESARLLIQVQTAATAVDGMNTTFDVTAIEISLP